MHTYSVRLDMVNTPSTMQQTLDQGFICVDAGRSLHYWPNLVSDWASQATINSSGIFAIGDVPDLGKNTYSGIRDHTYEK